MLLNNCLINMST